MDNDFFRAGCWHELIFEDAESSKYWSIKIHKNTHIRRWGPIGQEPRELVTSFPSQEDARLDAEQLFKSKIKGGYRIKQPQLICETALTHFVTDKNLNNFINQVYQLEDVFDFKEMEEVASGTSFTFYVDGDISQDLRKKLYDWIDGADIKHLTDLFLNDCARQRLIPAGTYVIETY